MKTLKVNNIQVVSCWSACFNPEKQNALVAKFGPSYRWKNTLRKGLLIHLATNRVLGTAVNDKDRAVNLPVEPTILSVLSRGHFGQEMSIMCRVWNVEMNS